MMKKMMKKNKIFVLIIVIILIVATLSGSQYVYSKYFYADKYTDLTHIAADKILSQNNQDYYVYFFLDQCPDCKAVSKQIRKLNKYVVLYSVDADDINDILPKYDWASHRSKYDVEIGIKEGNKILYNKNANKYLDCSKSNNMGHTMRYVEKVADDLYMEKNPNAKLNYVYASLATPYLDYSKIIYDTDVCIPGYPTLFHISDGKISEYYFDVPEIKPFIDKILKEF